MDIVVYDFDKTIYSGETSTDFMVFFLKRNPKYIFRLYLLIPSIIYFKFNLKKSKEFFFAILKNIEIDFLKKEIEAFWVENKSKIYNWVYNEIIINKKKSEKLVLISATPEIFLENISKDLGFDILIGTKFENNNKYFSNNIVGKNCKGEEKVSRLKKILYDFNILSFYSDSISDKPLFDLAKRKISVIKGEKIEGLPKN